MADRANGNITVIYDGVEVQAKLMELHDWFWGNVLVIRRDLGRPIKHTEHEMVLELALARLMREHGVPVAKVAT